MARRPPLPRPFPLPHTSQWHELQMLYNGQNAMHTLGIIAAANGKTDICGICGDDELVDDFIVQGNPGDQEFIVRWCEDCREIQAGMGVHHIRGAEPGEAVDPKTGYYDTEAHERWIAWRMMTQ